MCFSQIPTGASLWSTWSFMQGEFEETASGLFCTVLNGGFTVLVVELNWDSPDCLGCLSGELPRALLLFCCTLGVVPPSVGVLMSCKGLNVP